MASEKQRLDTVEAASPRAQRMSASPPSGGQMQKKTRDSMALHRVRLDSPSSGGVNQNNDQDDEMASEKQRLDIIEAARQRQLNAVRMTDSHPPGGQMQKKTRDSMALHRVRLESTSSGGVTQRNDQDDEMASAQKQRLDIIEAARQRQLNAVRM